MEEEQTETATETTAQEAANWVKSTAQDIIAYIESWPGATDHLAAAKVSIEAAIKSVESHFE